MCGCCGTVCRGWYDSKERLIRDLDCGADAIFLRIQQRRVNCPVCNAVKTERLAFVADPSRFTDRWVLWAGRQCRERSISSVAEESGVDRKTIKALEMEYMRRQLEISPPESPTVLGIDELAIGPGHSYRVIVHDLQRRRPVWVGGDKGRTQEAIDEYFVGLGPKACAGVQLAVMDMWKPYRKSAEEHCPNVRIHYDHFHIAKHLSEAIDEVRRSEYKRLEGQERKYIKGTRYILLSNRENLDDRGKDALDKLLGLNRRLNTAYLLKEQFDRIWSYRTETGARRFFDGWKNALKWQRLKPLEKFAQLVERHWTGIVCGKEVSAGIPMGFVEGMNTKIRAIQKRAYGIKDPEYLRLKILTTTLPKL